MGCTGTVPSGSNIDTSSVGQKTLTVTATDQAGDQVSQSVTYTVSYAICPLYDQTKAVHSGSTVPINLQLCDANAANASSSTITVTATSLVQTSTNAPGALESPGNSNPDNNFRFAGGSYIYNLSTKNLAAGTWALSFTAVGDPATHSVQFGIKP